MTIFNMVYFKNSLDFFYALGLVLNVIVFIPQAIKIYKTKHTKELSLIMFIGFNVGQFLAVINGLFYSDPYLIIGFLASFITCFFVVLLIILNRNCKKEILSSLLVYSLLIVVSLIVYLNYNNLYLKGIINALYTTSLFSTALFYILQIKKLLYFKDATNISLVMLIGFCYSQFFAITNGVMYGDMYLSLGYIPIFLCCLLLTTLVYYFKRSHNNVCCLS